MFRGRLTRRRSYERAVLITLSLVALYFFYRLVTLRSSDDGALIEPKLSDIAVTGAVLNHHMYFYLIDNTALCGREGVLPVFLLLLVVSHPNHSEQRQKLRDFYRSKAVAAVWGPRLVRVIFILAADPNDETHQAAIYEESSAYGDIVQEEYADEEYAASRKTMTAFKWAVTHCKAVSFVLKVNDNLLVNPRRTVSVLDDILEEIGRDVGKEKVIACHTMASQRAVRNQSDQLRYVPPSMYPDAWLPEHCNGDAYVVTFEMARHLFAVYQHMPYLPLEAVYVTGILRKAVPRARLIALDPQIGFENLAAYPSENDTQSVLTSSKAFLRVPIANVSAKRYRNTELPLSDPEFE